MACFSVAFLFVFLTIGSHFILTQACGCPDDLPQNQYCQADVVLKIKVKSAGEVVFVPMDESEPVRLATQDETNNVMLYQMNLRRRYKYKIQKIYRIGTKAKPKKPLFAYTPVSQSLCPGGLSEGIQYMMAEIAVLRGKPILQFNACMFARHSDQIPTHFKKKFKKGEFECHCDCKIAACYVPGCSEDIPNSRNECPFYNQGIDGFSYEKKWCERNSTTGVCEWTPGTGQC